MLFDIERDKQVFLYQRLISCNGYPKKWDTLSVFFTERIFSTIFLALLEFRIILSNRSNRQKTPPDPKSLVTSSYASVGIWSEAVVRDS